MLLPSTCTGDVFTTELLDREILSSYEFTISATNPLGDPPMVSTATIRVMLQDVNDNQPIFSRNTYSGVITTRTQVGTAILSVSAVDSDLAGNGAVEYSLIEQSNLFIVDLLSGEVTLISEISDTETFQLVVMATDQGNPRLSSNATVIIRVVPPVQVEFSQDGAGFLLAGASAVQQPIGESKTSVFNQWV